ncbi:MAG: hypothetical protein MJY70_03450 [Bacteroidales bacterium]|nr:hypothetical protein [Bacteroidales bacterium]
MKENNKKHFLEVFTQETRDNKLVKNLYKNIAYCNVEDNIYPDEMPENFRKMFINGSGNELKEKARAIYSSSMLAFNFFHWISSEHPFTLDKHKFTKVYFEVQMPTLQGSTPANMDVVLEEIHQDGKRTLLFIESKFTEHFSNSYKEMVRMSDNSYSKKNTKLPYYPENDKHFNEWKDIINHFAKQSQERKGYYDGIKQELCHFIALSNLKNDKKAREDYDRLYENKPDIEHPKITGEEDFLFYNILFEPADRFIECEKFSDYSNLYTKLKDKIGFAINNIEANIYSYRKVYDSIESTNKEIKRYLYQRYMSFSK